VGFSGNDLVNIVKAAHQFGLQKAGTRIAALVFFSTDLIAIGQQNAAGITFVMPAYNDMNDQAKAWAQRFEKLAGKPPSWGHMADYEGTLHYLRAVRSAGTDDAQKVVPMMRSMPINVFSVQDAEIREDNKLVRPMYLTRVKAPADSRYPGDFYEIIGKVSAKDAYAPMNPACSLVKSK
jgi:branched-chain amino acid transport system substrate-binding protein